MSQNTPKEAKAIKALLEFSEDAELTDEEVDAELKADGVDVDAFVAKALAKIELRKKAARLAWQSAARSKAEGFERQRSRERYAGLPREALLGLLRERQPAQVAFRNFEELTEDDLRSLLADADDLKEDGVE